MAKTFELERFDVFGEGRYLPASDGYWIKAQDAIDREKVNAARIHALKLQLKEAKAIQQPVCPICHGHSKPGDSSCPCRM